MLSGVLIWLSKNWITERLKNAIKHEYDTKLELHKALLSVAISKEVETLKSRLQFEAGKELEVLKEHPEQDHLFPHGRDQA